MGSVIVVPSIRFECCNPNLSGNHGDHLNPQLHHVLGHHRDRVGLGRSAIYQQMSEGRFLKFRSLGPKCAVWVEAEIEEWIRRIISD
ncbi:MAG: hypothetical protein CVT74_01150 [Alphaproteobacteria bacterium HGW-Alphaproteobacteria-13]|nr:MAG: hypothetical protein CVT74_01150 [Alphaproteobacteria bacterium HGW-Alphaproteobacteria-13]